MAKERLEAVIGIDVGYTGASVLMSISRQVLDISYNYQGPRTYVETIRAWMLKFNIVAVLIENQHAWPQQGVSSTFALGQTFGELIGVMAAFKLAYSFVDPRAWQKVMLEGTSPVKDSKVRAALAVKHLFTGIELKRTPRCTVQHDGAVDALLIAEACRRLYCAKKFETEDQWITSEQIPLNDYSDEEQSL